MSVSKGQTHIVIGDTQCKPGVEADHLGWVGRYIVDQFGGRPDVKICHLGDHWDMPSLSSYDKGKKEMEGRRYKADIKAGNDGLLALTTPLLKYNAALRKAGKKQWKPERYLLRGNHENRINRAVEMDAQLEGVLTDEDFNDVALGWTPVPFLEVLWLDGVGYSHYFYNHSTGKPLGGENLYTRLKTIGHSFTMGHQQGIKVASREVGNGRHMGLVLGSTYLHDERYLGPQANKEWRGIVVCHQVESGGYDRMEVSLDFLCRKYENVTLAEFLGRRGHNRTQGR